jgi:hypothetical protein
MRALEARPADQVWEIDEYLRRKEQLIAVIIESSKM